MPNEEDRDRGPKPDLSKQFHLVGTNKVVLATADSRAEADEILSDFHKAKAREMERMQLFLEHPSPVIHNMGVKHPSTAAETVDVPLEELEPEPAQQPVQVATRPPPPPRMEDRPKPPDPTPPGAQTEVTSTTPTNPGGQ